MDKFRGKRAFVTGGGSGIGRQVALKLAELGAEVYTVSRTEKNLKSLEEENPKIKTITLDITDHEKTRKIVEGLAPIHLLVNNAGTAFASSCLEASLVEFDRTYEINVKSFFNLSQVVSKGLIERKLGGKIVNVSSQAGLKPLLNHSIYCSSKAAVEMLTRAFALELGPHNIRVNTVSPTVVWTELAKLYWSDPVKANEMKSKIPQGRFAEISEVVNVIVFLLSDESEMVHGHAIPIDGGYIGCI